MGFFSSVFPKSPKDGQQNAQSQAPENSNPQQNYMSGMMSDRIPDMYLGMTLSIFYEDGKTLLTGILTDFSNVSMVIERKPGQLSFDICDAGTPVLVRGFSRGFTVPFELNATVESSSRIRYRLRNLKSVPFNEQRTNYRLSINSPVRLFYEDDTNYQNPEPCKLVNLSATGACIESEFIHGENEVLWLKMQIEDYMPMTLLGQVVRVEEPSHGVFHYGFLFAQLDQQQSAALSRMIFNIQTDFRKNRQRNSGSYGHW